MNYNPSAFTGYGIPISPQVTTPINSAGGGNIMQFLMGILGQAAKNKFGTVSQDEEIAKSGLPYAIVNGRLVLGNGISPGSTAPFNATGLSPNYSIPNGTQAGF